jgi:tetratricopeptide (TPR) repeat protein
MYQYILAHSPQETFAAANNHYQNNEFQEAAALYEKIISQGYESAAVYYNLGNCYFKLNETGRAILNYERALKLEPHNDDISFNLKLANLRVADRIEPAPQMMLIAWFKKIISSLSSDGWGVMSLVFVWISMFFMAAYLFIRKIHIRRFLFFAGVLLLFLAVIATLLAWKQYHNEHNQRFGIVMVTNTYIKSAPAANAIDLFILREGVKAEILEEANGWHKIRLADGKIGWIQQEHIETI